MGRGASTHLITCCLLLPSSCDSHLTWPCLVSFRCRTRDRAHIAASWVTHRILAWDFEPVHVSEEKLGAECWRTSYFCCDCCKGCLYIRLVFCALHGCIIPRPDPHVHLLWFACGRVDSCGEPPVASLLPSPLQGTKMKKREELETPSFTTSIPASVQVEWPPLPSHQPSRGPTDRRPAAPTAAATVPYRPGRSGRAVERGRLDWPVRSHAARQGLQYFRGRPVRACDSSVYVWRHCSVLSLVISVCPMVHLSVYLSICLSFRSWLVAALATSLLRL